MKLTTAEPDERDQVLEELMAIRSGRPVGPRGRTRERGSPPRRATPGNAGAGSERGARQCPNCAETHASLKCPHPPVDREKRQCWNCKQIRHSSASCPKAKAPRPPGGIRTVEAENEPRMTMAVTEGSFVEPRRTARPRPTPSKVTFRDCLANAFVPLRPERTAHAPQLCMHIGEPELARPAPAAVHGAPELQRPTTTTTTTTTTSEPRDNATRRLRSAIGRPTAISHGHTRPDIRLSTSGAASVSQLTSLRSKRHVEEPSASQ